MLIKPHGLLCDLHNIRVLQKSGKDFFQVYAPSTDASLVISRTLAALVLRASEIDKNLEYFREMSATLVQQS